MKNKEYSVSPSSIRFDQEMVEFNRIPDEAEYEATKLSIISIGQQAPISINSKTGLCEDGRTRCKVCNELGIEVKCIEIDGNIDKAERLAIYNMNAMSGRDLTSAQKAIQAHKYAKLTKEPLEVSAKRYKSTLRQVSDANTIAGLGRNDILDAISKTGSWLNPVTKKQVKNLRAIASELRAEKEELENITDMTSKIDYESMINTERGKSEFWQLRTVMQMSQHESDMILVKMLNYKYVLKVNKETGEIDER